MDFVSMLNHSLSEAEDFMERFDSGDTKLTIAEEWQILESLWEALGAAKGLGLRVRYALFGESK